MSKNFILYIKSALPPSSSSEKYFDLTGYFSKETTAAPPADSLKFWIGRDNDCQLKIADEKISRHHCCIEKTPKGNLRLVDNDSANGSFVNGIKASEVILNQGDSISIGSYEMALNPSASQPAGVSPDIHRVEPVRPADQLIGRPAEIPLPRLHTVDEHGKKKQKTSAPSSTSQLLAAVFVIIIGIVFFMVLFRSKDDTTDYVENIKKPSPTSESITTTEHAVSSLPPVTTPASVTSVTPVSNTAITLKPPTSAELTRKTIEEFEKQQQPLKAQKEKEEAERQAKLKAEQEAQAALIRQQEEQKQLTEGKPRWSEHKTKIAFLLTKYQYVNAIESLNGFLKDIKIESIKTEINGYIEDLQGEYSLFKNMTNNLATSSSRKKIVIDNRTIWITKADEVGFEGTIAGVSGSVYARNWADIPQEAVLDLFSDDLAKLDRFYLATFCHNHNLSRDGERKLISCLKTYPDEKQRIDRFLVRYRDIPLPPGGFYEYQGQLITAEEKSYLEKGYVKYQGKWMSYDEMMAAKGFVKFQNKWVTLEEKTKIEARLNALTSLKKQLAPTGAIDKPGADKEKLSWDKARTKETEHYILKTNLTEEALNDLCYVMECLYFEHKKIFKLARDPGAKLPVWVFKEAKEYQASGGMGQGVYMGGGGPGGGGNQIMTYYQPLGGGLTTSSVLLHEGTHQFVDLVCNVAKVPIWINEGLATYYESSKFEGSSLKTNVVNQNRLQMIRQLIIQKDVPRLEDIINIRQANFAIYEYAHTWSLVYFFMNYNNGQYADELENYFEAIKKKGFENRPKHKQLFEDSFKVKFEVLEKQWEDYILKLK